MSNSTPGQRGDSRVLRSLIDSGQIQVYKHEDLAAAMSMTPTDIVSMQGELARLRAENERLRDVLLWTLYRHQGGHCNVGQLIRKVLGIGEFAPLTAEQVARATAAAMALSNPGNEQAETTDPPGPEGGK